MAAAGTFCWPLLTRMGKREVEVGRITGEVELVPMRSEGKTARVGVRILRGSVDVELYDEWLEIV